MTEREKVLSELFALWDGEVVEATALTSAIASLANAPIETWLPSLTAAARADLNDVPAKIIALPHLAPDAKLLLARRLGWVAQVFSQCPPGQDGGRLWLEAAVLAISHWDEDGCFWRAAQQSIIFSSPMLGILEGILRGRTPQVSAVEQAPIWEREHLEALNEADRRGDWAKLAHRTSSFSRLPVLDHGARLSALGLLALDWPRLVRIASSSKSWLEAHLVSSALPLADAFRLATATRNDHVRFATLERVACREVRLLSLSENRALRNLLIALAGDEHWPAWLQVFNRYPVRSPHMQAALGEALTRCRPAALKAYVGSISLDRSAQGCRTSVTDCLTVFRANACLSRRHILWRAAFDRWEAWNFEIGEERPLTEIARCTLDYGIVGWLVEGESLGPPEAPDHRFARELGDLDVQWHRSSTSARSGFLRLLSRHQILAHAASVTTLQTDWLPDGSNYQPSGGVNAFAAQRYSSIL